MFLFAILGVDHAQNLLQKGGYVCSYN